jgi:hypothetical protein
MASHIILNRVTPLPHSLITHECYLRNYGRPLSGVGMARTFHLLRTLLSPKPRDLMTKGPWQITY